MYMSVWYIIYEFKISKTKKLEKKSCVLDRVYSANIYNKIYTPKKVKVAKVLVAASGHIFVNVNVILGRLPPQI